MRYHISSKGESAKCEAPPGKCPLNGEHFDSPEEAQEHHEKTQKSSEFASITKKTSLPKMSESEENAAYEASDSTNLELWESMGTYEVSSPAIYEAEAKGPEAVRQLDGIVTKAGGDPKKEVAHYVIEEDYTEGSKLRTLMGGHDEEGDAADDYAESLEAKARDVQDQMMDDPKVYKRVMSKYFRKNEHVRVAEGRKSYIVATRPRDEWDSWGRDEEKQIQDDLAEIEDSKSD